MESTQAVINPTTPTNQDIHTPKFTLPDHTQLPDSDGTFVKNFQEHPQSIVLTSSIEPILQKIHPDGNYCIGQDSGIYWRLTDPPEKGAEAPDWFYVPNVPPKLNGDYRCSYVLWKEFVAPLIAIEFVSGNGEEERDKTPPSETAKAGKFWVYEQAIRIPFYGIFEARKALLEVYRLVDGSYQKIQLNERGHFSIPPMGVELGLIEDDGVPWVRWWDDGGNLLLTGDERAIVEKQARLEAEEIAQQAKLAQQQAEEIAQQERQKKEKLAAYLRSLGVNPDDI
ncbi:Uma2 family endonuclease [Sphaerospermopsis sp. FACHB-1194]|uniref:Uma2 family endonuclease n=1 Tax=Sphaerospermopsis sp. FACHB-1194 TaxID=2692862 RepID=UPI001681A899|nr:Uma2 family endonuclease [Sphaerospermopsis sp. FACHB-1194]MBD2144654.1 Uma2 family endonuclease [Sphaerospermopsis sp. FACHB-1194]